MKNRLILFRLFSKKFKNNNHNNGSVTSVKDQIITQLNPKKRGGNRRK